MVHVVTERCIDCRHMECAVVCPTECFHEIADPAMLVIDPECCIDCELCRGQCPVHAIYHDEDVPEPYRPWIARNAELAAKTESVMLCKGPLPTALDLRAIQEREKARGLMIREP